MTPDELSIRQAPTQGLENPEVAELLGPIEPSRITAFFFFCAGAEPEIVSRTRTERATYVGLGGTVLATGVLAAVSSTFALSMAFNQTWWKILPVSILWGLIIFNLDRWLVASFRPLRSQLLTFLSVVPRMLLAGLFGLIIAEPMLLRMFESEIEEELIDITSEDRERRLDLVSDGSEAEQIAIKQGEIDELRDRLGSSTDASVVELQADVTQLQETNQGLRREIDDAEVAVNQAQAAVTEEVANGCVDGSDGCRPGDGPIAAEKRQTVINLQIELDEVRERNNPQIDNNADRITQLTQQIDDRREEIQGSRAAANLAIEEDIAELEDEITALEAIQVEQRTEITDNLEEVEYGLLARIEALDRVRSGSSRVNRLYWTLAALFIAIDIIPVVGKWLQSLGKKKSYDRIRDTMEDLLDYELDQLLHQGREQIRSASERTRYLQGAIAANQQHLTNYAGAIQRSLAEGALAKWESEQALSSDYRPVGQVQLPPVPHNIEPPPNPQEPLPRHEGDGAEGPDGEEVVAKGRRSPVRWLRDISAAARGRSGRRSAQPERSVPTPGPTPVPAPGPEVPGSSVPFGAATPPPPPQTPIEYHAYRPDVQGPSFAEAGPEADIDLREKTEDPRGDEVPSTKSFFVDDFDGPLARVVDSDHWSDGPDPQAADVNQDDSFRDNPNATVEEGD